MLRKILFISIIFMFKGLMLLNGQVNHSIVFERQYKICDTMLEDNNVYKRILYPDIPRTDKIGFPELPVKYIRLIIPSESDASGIVLKKAKKEHIKIDRLIKPVQHPEPTSINYKKQDFVKPNKDVYSSTKPYPDNIVEIVHQGRFQGNRIVTLGVYPFQYYPNHNYLYFYSSVEFTLNLKISDKKSIGVMFKNKNNRLTYDKILEDLVDNPEDIESYQVQSSIEKEYGIRSTSEWTVPFYEYVVITSNNLASAFNEFISWKMYVFKLSWTK